MSCTRAIINELPYSNWLHEYLTNTLDSFGFIVDTQNRLIKPMALVNEYVNSQPDILIFYSKHHVKTVTALLLKVIYPHVDVLCDNEILVEGEEVAMAGELKVENVRDDAINECFYNMFGQGANLALRAILYLEN